jgi:FkbM family methyltransferase
MQQPPLPRPQRITHVPTQLQREGWRLEAPLPHAHRWTSPSGQALHSFVTRTEPRFVFAHNPRDNDMARMARQGVLEPALTLAWHDAARACCRDRRGTVVDVGGNFGWYTLYSIALGCDVFVVEPVPAWLEVLTLGVALNPGFARHVRIARNVVYPERGNYTLRVPQPKGEGRMYLGMTYMQGSAGMLKGYKDHETYAHVAQSVRLDDVVRSNDVCLLKADVEGYEPQVLHTAQRLFAQRRVHALQLEMTRPTPGTTQRCATIKMLEHLDALGYAFKQVSHAQADAVALPRVGEWANADGFGPLADFPSNETRARAAREGLSPMRAAYEWDFAAVLSTNLVARRVNWDAGVGRPWPTLEC